MSLAFLAKKSWHTTNLKNQEKVWLAEQNAQKEAKKVEQLRKQIDEERQLDELREVQRKAGNNLSTQERVDWIYEGPGAAQAAATDEYLLGKEFKPSDIKQDIELKKDPGALWMNKISAKNDMFTRLHEDPMLQIKKSELEARERVVNNPVKMARIKKQLQDDMDAEKRRKAEKKARKKELKGKKEHKDKKERKDRKNEKRKRSHDDDSEIPDGRKHSQDDEKQNPQGYNKISRSDDTRDTKGMDRDVPHEDRKRGRSDTSDKHDDEQREGKRYGLISNADSRSASERTHLGPKQELLVEAERKRRMLKEANEEKRRRNTAGLTDEERERRIREMQENAVTHHHIRSERMSTSKRKGELGEDEERGKGARFLQDMQRAAYGHEGDPSASQGLQERLHTKRHYYQKGEDLEGNFLHK